MRRPIRSSLLVAALAVPLLLLGGCQRDPNRVTADTAHKFAAIGEDEAVEFTGTEPFWGGKAQGAVLTYRTPDNPEGWTIAVKRFSGLNGLSLSGSWNGDAFDLLVTEGQCNDGMSDRTYPFTVTLKVGKETRTGCAWTESKPFTGPKAP